MECAFIVIDNQGVCYFPLFLFFLKARGQSTVIRCEGKPTEQEGTSRPRSGRRSLARMVHDPSAAGCCGRGNATALACQVSFVERDARDGMRVSHRRMRDTFHEELAFGRRLDEPS
jgi:hypothetical protein